MWSIHPSQIDPIVRAFSPNRLEIDEAAAFSSLRKRPIGRRYALPASCTIARRIAIAGACCNVRVRRERQCRPTPRRFFRMRNAHERRRAVPRRELLPSGAAQRQNWPMRPRAWGTTVAWGKISYSRRAENPLQVAGAINAYAARMAERVGFKALYLSGGGVAANSLGMPDLGISTLEDVLIDVRRITDVRRCRCSSTSTPVGEARSTLRGRFAR